MSALPRKELTLVDSVALIVGIIVGAGIFQVAPDVARGTGSAEAFLGIWLLGGLLSLCGALGYAELATTYPQAGGDYAYLTRAYGPWAGFLFGWLQLVVVRPGDIAVMAFAFATYAGALFGPVAGLGGWSRQAFACLAVLVLTAINIAGVRQGKRTQNLLTLVKVLGLSGIALAAFAAPAPGAAPAPLDPLPASLALIFVLFTFGGWNEMAYVAAEVKNPGRNIARALLLGTTAVTALYLVVNGAYLHALGFNRLTGSSAVATDTVASLFPAAAPPLISALVCISALGAVNGLILTGARISFALGRDHRPFRYVGQWQEDRSTPTRALVVQGAIAVVLILALGTFLNAILYTAAPVYLFYLATNLAVMVLRRKDPAAPRSFRVWAYPVPTLIFCVTSGFLAWSAIVYKPWVAAAALGLLVLGLPIYWIGRRSARPAVSGPST